MKKCLKCGQIKGIKDSHKFCHNCGGNVFEVTRKEVVIGDIRKAAAVSSDIRIDGKAISEAARDNIQGVLEPFGNSFR